LSTGLAGDLMAQTVSACPAELKAVATCYTGSDQNGASYWIAIPQNWNKVLVMHAHGGPRLTAVAPDDSLADLKRFAVTVRQGYGWAGSSYRRPGYGTRMAAQDTDNLRKIFLQRFGQPERTILHGQSYGGNIAAKAIELAGVNANGKPDYDGAVITSGLVAGGSQNYLHRVDLRAVYQYYCHNHPRPNETQYPLWMGLPANGKMKRTELEARVNECTGILLPAEKRSELQRSNLANILGVIKVEEKELVAHLSWATVMFRDIVTRLLDGGNPFSNRSAIYRGSSDDVALNRDVLRFDAEPEAAARMADDSDMSGKFSIPVITMHAINDPVALVEYEAAYREIVERAGGGARLVQVFTTENVHSKLADPEYAALFKAMMEWIGGAAAPTPAQIAASCADYAKELSGGCHFDVAYRPKGLFTRVAPREAANR
jgi:hypothetical protein